MLSAVSSPMKSSRARGPIGWPQPSRMAASMWAVPATPCSSSCWPSRAGKAFVAIDDVRAAAAALAQGATTGRVDTDAGPLVWELGFHGGAAPVRGPAWLDRMPAPTRVAHVRSEARVTGTVRLGDGPTRRVDGVGAVKHIWGTRRVDELFWLYCPLLDDGGAIALRRRGLPSGSPPPMRAAVVTSRISFVKTLPRAASIAPFFRLIVAHFEWPLMGRV